jgi:anionic cell wall polymer biosynthesis LytR-Cps2A-Psr (LCP) family protein
MKLSRSARLAFIAIITASTVLCGPGSVFAHAPRQDQSPEPEPIPARAPRISLPPGTFNIALLGVDKRPERGFLNTDVIIIASINPDVPAVTLFSIPRDTPAYIPGVGVQKINTAYAIGGPDLFKETIRYNFGIDIANYAMVNFAGVVHAVDALGGVDVIATCPIDHTFPRDPYYMGGLVTPRDYIDTFSGEVWPAGTRIPLLRIDLPKPGVYSLDGLQALAYVRARKGIPGGDVDRGRREQRVVRAILAKVRQDGSLARLTELYNAVKADVESDLSLEAILRYALMANSIGDAVIRSRYLSGYDANGAALEGAPTRAYFNNRLAYVEQALTVALNQRINDGIPIEVLNGTGDPGFALAAADRLKEIGFVVTAIKPADQAYKSTVIIDHTTTKKGSPLPLLLRTFNLKQKAVQADPRPEGPRFTVIIGPDFNTCYYAGSLRAAGSEPIERDTPQEVVLPLEASVVVTNTADIEAAVVEASTTTSVVVAATELLTPTAIAGPAPLTPTALLTPRFYVQQGDLVNVRSAPTTRSRAIGRLRGPFDGDIMGRSLDGQWLQFLVPRSNRLGWVSTEVVQVTGYFEEPPLTADGATPIPQPVVADPPRVVIPIGDIVNVRNGPGTEFDILGRMGSSQSASIIGRSGDGAWWQIFYRERPAWISADFVRAAGDLINIPTVTAPPLSGQTP